MKRTCLSNVNGTRFWPVSCRGRLNTGQHVRRLTNSCALVLWSSAAAWVAGQPPANHRLNQPDCSATATAASMLCQLHEVCDAQ